MNKTATIVIALICIALFAVMFLPLMNVPNLPLLPIKKENKVVVFVVDSTVDMTDKTRNTLNFFPDLSHEYLVTSIIRDLGEPHKLNILPVDNSQGRIERILYYLALRTIDTFSQDHPNYRIVVNLSFGSSDYTIQEKSLIENLVQKGVIVLAAAGNSGAEQAHYPAAFDGVIAVAASDGNEKAAYSNFGNQIDIMANGRYHKMEQIRVTTPEGYEYQRREAEVQGTSFATARVTGTIATMLCWASGDPIDVEQILKSTADPIESSLFQLGKLGAGNLNTHRALKAVKPYYLYESIIRALLRLFIYIGALALPIYGRFVGGDDDHSRVIKWSRYGKFVVIILMICLRAFLWDQVDIHLILPEFINLLTTGIIGSSILWISIVVIVILNGSAFGTLIAYVYTMIILRYYIYTKNTHGLDYEKKQIRGEYGGYTDSMMVKKIVECLEKHSDTMTP